MIYQTGIIIIASIVLGMITAIIFHLLILVARELKEKQEEKKFKVKRVGKIMTKFEMKI